MAQGTPACGVPSRHRGFYADGLAGAHEVLGGELLQPHEAAALTPVGGVGVEVLVGRTVGEEVGVGLAFVEVRG